MEQQNAIDVRKGQDRPGKGGDGGCCPVDRDPLAQHQPALHCPAQQATEAHLGQLPRPPEGLGQQGRSILYVRLQNSDARAAVEVLKAVGIYGQLPPPSGPEDAELVLWEVAKTWAELEFNKQRRSIDSLMAFTLGEIEIPALAQQRMEELQEQFGQ